MSGRWAWGTCNGRLGEPWKIELGEPGGATFWSLHIDKKSKNSIKAKLRKYPSKTLIDILYNLAFANLALAMLAFAHLALDHVDLVNST